MPLRLAMPRITVVALALALLATTALIHSALLIRDPILLSWDDALLLEPLQRAPWVRTAFSAETLDVQPLRDLSLLLDVKLAAYSGGSTFHLTNLALWWLILWALAGLLAEIGLPPGARRWALALYAVHPVFVQSVGWISARKHLLAALFIVLATSLFLRLLRSPRRIWVGLLPPALFALSVFSHPMALLWPSWALALALARGQLLRRDVLPGVVLAVGVAGACLSLNLAYYGGAFVDAHGNDPKVLDLAARYDWIPLMYGRYAINLLLPHDLAAVYSTYTVTNVLGIGLSVLWVYAALKLLGWRRAAGWLWLFLLPLLPVTLNVTPVFVLDSYLLIPSVAACVLLTQMVQVAQRRLQGRHLVLVGTALLASLFVTFGLAARAQARHWLDDEALWHRAATVQADPNSVRAYLDVLLRGPLTAPRAAAARDAIEELARFPYQGRERDVVVRSLRLLLAIEASPILSAQDKRLALEGFVFEHYQKHALLGELYEASGDDARAYDACLRAARMRGATVAGLRPWSDVQARLLRLGARLGRADHARWTTREWVAGRDDQARVTPGSVQPARVEPPPPPQ